MDDEFSERFSRVYEKGDNAHADTQGPAAGFYTPVPIIHNLVCTSALHCSKTPIDLDYICSKLPNSFYDRKRFAATTIRLVDPVCTGLLFSSGKLVLTGCKSHKQAVLATLKITRLLNVFTDGCTFQLCDGVQVQNVVGHSDLMLKPWQTLDIKRFYDDNQSVCTYQKSLFPGLILRVPGSPVVILCFLSGRIVVTGGKQEIDILSGFKPLYAMLRKYIC